MISFTSRAKSFSTAFGSNSGQDIRSDELLPALFASLPKAVGQLHLHKERLLTKLPSRVYTVVPNKANAIRKILKDLDFSVLQITTSGYIGGTRLEADFNKTTVVNYCSFSGILVITSTLEFPQ